jgi:hypothetical protein
MRNAALFVVCAALWLAPAGQAKSDVIQTPRMTTASLSSPAKDSASAPRAWPRAGKKRDGGPSMRADPRTRAHQGESSVCLGDPITCRMSSARALSRSGFSTTRAKPA